MTKLKIILILSFSWIYLEGNACNCYGVSSFVLSEYDDAKYIAEIEFLSVKDYREQDKKQWEKFHQGKVKFPPKKRRYHLEFTIKTHSFYKGDSTNITKFIPAGSSCQWIPKLRHKYLIYFHKTYSKNNNIYFEVDACNRKMDTSEEKNRYASEKEILCYFQNPQDGRFAFDQKTLIKERKDTFISIKGDFKDKKRVGIWYLSVPLFYDEQYDKNIPLVLELKYKKGTLIDIQYIDNKKVDIEAKHMILRWLSFYEINILEKD